MTHKPNRLMYQGWVSVYRLFWEVSRCYWARFRAIRCAVSGVLIELSTKRFECSLFRWQPAYWSNPFYLWGHWPLLQSTPSPSSKDSCTSSNFPWEEQASHGRLTTTNLSRFWFLPPGCSFGGRVDLWVTVRLRLSAGWFVWVFKPSIPAFIGFIAVS